MEENNSVTKCFCGPVTCGADCVKPLEQHKFKMNKHLLQFICLSILLNCASPALACNVCSMAYFDYYTPPLLGWQFFPIIWFIVACYYSNQHNSQLWWLPKTWKAITIGICTFIFGNAIGFGPLLSLPLLIPPFILALKSINKKTRRNWNTSQRKQYVAVSVLGSLILVSLFVALGYIRLTRSPSDYVIKWGADGKGRNFIETINKDAANNLDQIRAIISKANIQTSANLVDSLAVFGNTTIDFPILLSVLERAKGRKYIEEDIEIALNKLTKLELPSGTNVNDWKIALEKQQQEK